MQSRLLAKAAAHRGLTTQAAHSRHWDFVAGSSAAQEACRYFPHMLLSCPHLAPCQGAETPGSQAAKLYGSRSDRRSRFDCHSVGSCLEGSVVGSVGCQAFAPSAS